MSDIALGVRSAVASGNITTCTFVILDTANEFQVLQSTAGAKIFGVSQNWASSPTIVGGATTYAATTGQQLAVFVEPAECLLTVGAGGVTVGDRLKSDASGNGITTTTSGDYTGAQALETGAAGDLVRVRVETYVIH